MTWGSKVGSDEPGQPMHLSFDAVRNDAAVSGAPPFRHVWMRKLYEDMSRGAKSIKRGCLVLRGLADADW